MSPSDWMSGFLNIKETAFSHIPEGIVMGGSNGVLFSFCCNN